MLKSLKFKIVVATFFLLALPLILTGFVLRADAEGLLARLLKGRYEYVVLDLRSTIQTGFDMRLSLNQMANLNSATKRAFEADEVIQAIEIYGPDGTILFRAGAKTRNQLVPDTWRRATREPKTRIWSVDDDDSLVIGADIVGGDGKVVGGIALRARRASVLNSTARYGRDLRRLGAMIFLIGWIVAGLGAILLVGSVARQIMRVTGALKGTSRAAPATEVEALGRETASNAAAIFKAIDRARRGANKTAPPAAEGKTSS